MTIPPLTVGLMKGTNALQMQRQRFNNIGGEHCYPIFSPFAVPYEDLIHREVDIFDPQSQAFHQHEAAAVKQFNDEARLAGHQVDDPQGVLFGKYNRQSGRPFCPDGINGIWNVDMKHFVVEKDQCIKGLVLCRCGNAAVDGEMG